MMEFPLKTLALSTSGRAVLGLSLGLALSGCAVGPDFKAPEAPAQTVSSSSDAYSYTSTPVATQTEASEGKSGISQKLVVAQDIPAQWWEVFHSEELDTLIRQALTQSPDLASAQAALRQAKENYNAQSGNTLYPNVSANLGAGRDLASAVSTNVPGGELYNLYNASVNVSYTLDIFGANKRELESMQAAVDYQRFQVEAAYLSLTANLVTTAIKEASLRAQIQATEEILQFQAKQLEVMERQLTLGGIPKVSVLEQRNLLAQTRASLPGLEKSLQQTRNQLAVYAGRLPSDTGLPEFHLDSLQLPQELPVSIPSALVRQRPDIRANEALLHQASAQVGVATANQYPQFTLSASYGSAALTPGNLFKKEWSLWSLGAGITQPIFNGGALSAKRRAALAAYDQIDAQYRSNVLSAFQSVADSLQALDFDAKTLKQQVEVEAIAKQTLDLTTQQFNLGAVNSLALLDAKRTYQTARIGLVQAQAARYADTAALFQSLGGGWWNRPDLKDISVKNE
ncbi:efflux transporter outer membrane subunit [Solimicrobium silvestre]|nr:efflux transporter outer membrane subunit [Solimicrobium silvestre]